MHMWTRLAPGAGVDGPRRRPAGRHLAGAGGVSVTVYRATSGGAMNLRWLSGYALITETGTSLCRRGNRHSLRGRRRRHPARQRDRPRPAARVSRRIIDAGCFRRRLARPRRWGGRFISAAPNRATGKDDRAGGDHPLRTRRHRRAADERGVRGSALHRATTRLSSTAKCRPASRPSRPSSVTHPRRCAGRGGRHAFLSRRPFRLAADYVATLAPDERLDLFAWVTLANADDEAFVHATPRRWRDSRTGTRIGGSLARRRCRLKSPFIAGPQARRATDLSLPPGRHRGTGYRISARHCRHRHAQAGVRDGGLRPASAPAPGVTAQQEDLGDLKLYRIPDPVTVAANARSRSRCSIGACQFQLFYAATISATMMTTNRSKPPACCGRRMRRKRGSACRCLPEAWPLFEPAEGRPLLDRRRRQSPTRRSGRTGDQSWRESGRVSGA